MVYVLICGLHQCTREVEEELVQTSPRDYDMGVARNKKQRWFSILFR